MAGDETFAGPNFGRNLSQQVIGGRLEIGPNGQITGPDGQRPPAPIADAANAAGSTPTQAEFNALVTKFNAALAALRLVGINRTS